MSDIADNFIVVSGRSDRHVIGIANRAIDAAAERGISPSTIEGLEKGHWVLLDFGDVVLHVFYEPLRAHYNLENLWAEARRIDLRQIGAAA
jgi:ribosome-associated protein